MDTHFAYRLVTRMLRNGHITYTVAGPTQTNAQLLCGNSKCVFTVSADRRGSKNGVFFMPDFRQAITTYRGEGRVFLGTL